MGFCKREPTAARRVDGLPIGRDPLAPRIGQSREGLEIHAASLGAPSPGVVSGETWDDPVDGSGQREGTTMSEQDTEGFGEAQGGSGGVRERLQKQGEDALGRVAQELLESPLLHGALARAFDAREKAVQAQEAAMGALNLPSAADLERLTRRVRSLSQRLEGIEDGVDRLDERLGSLPGGNLDARLSAIEIALDARLTAIEESLDKVAREVEAVRKKLPATAPRRSTAKKASS